MQTKKILLTGAQGFLGRHIAQILLQEGYAVTGLGRGEMLAETFTHYYTIDKQKIPAYLPFNSIVFNTSSYKYYSVNLLNAEKLDSIVKIIEPDIVIHCASAIRDDDYVDLADTNIKGTIHLFKAIEELNVSKFILISGGGVYGNPNNEQQPPYKETDTCSPADIYSISKYSQEMIARNYATKLGISLQIHRVFNISGPGQDQRHLCGALALKLMNCDTKVIFTGDLSTTRDYVDVRDVARAVNFLIPQKLDFQEINICTGIETSGNLIFNILKKQFELEEDIKAKQVNKGPNPIKKHYGNSTRLLSTGFNFNYTITDSLCDLVEYYKNTLNYEYYH